MSLSYLTLPFNVARPFCLLDVAEFETKASQMFKTLHAYAGTIPIVFIDSILVCPDMIYCEITLNRSNHILIRNHLPDGDTLELQNGGYPCDVAVHIIAVVFILNSDGGAI